MDAKMEIAYGICTVPARRKTTLPRTLASLAKAGFTAPVLSVDGDGDKAGWEAEFGLPVLCHPSRIGSPRNWVGLIENLLTGQADLFLIFEDDILSVKNLRTYLETVPPPDNGYGNLGLWPKNHETLKRRNHLQRGWQLSNQRGLGAQGLIFTRETITRILAKLEISRATVIDGPVVDAAKCAGIREYVHYPSLVDHQISPSVMGHHYRFRLPTFPGEDFDAATWMQPLSSVV
jgi:hypothetical protein